MHENQVFDRLDVFFLVLFFISWINSLTLVLFFLSLLFLLFRRIEGCLKGLILLTTRGLINPAAAVPTGRFDLLKWMLLFLFSIYILLFARAAEEDRHRLLRIIGSIAAFSISAAILSFIVSSYPVTAVFKIIAFMIPVCAVFLGVSASDLPEYWIGYFTALYGILFLISIFLIPFDRFRTVNSDFQGIFNHVNVFGVIAALYASALLRSQYFTQHPGKGKMLILMLVVMIYLSRSRSGMFTLSGILFLKFLFSGQPLSRKVLACISMTAVLILIQLLMPENISTDISAYTKDFIYKGDESSVWAHRQGQLNDARMKFTAHILTGSGFMVPYDPAVRDYRFTFSLVVEPGNLFWAVLGDTGLIGFVLFLYVLFCIISSGTKRDLYLPAGALAVNMGEMVFFSPNNYSVLIYLLLAVYVSGRKEED